MSKAKKMLLNQIQKTRREKPYLLPYYKYVEHMTMVGIMERFIEAAHNRRMEILFDDTETLAYLHLLEKPQLEIALSYGFNAPTLKALVANKEERPPIQLRFKTTRYEPGEGPQIENLVNPDVYETIIRDKNAFYVCSYHDLTAIISSYVMKEEIRLTDLEASYARYTESLSILNERIDRFITEHNLSEDMDTVLLTTRKKEIGRWLYDRYVDCGQFIQFTDQETHGETPYTMRQLLTSKSEVSHLLVLMLGVIGLRSNPPKSGKKTVLFVSCQEYKCCAPYLVDFCRYNPTLVRNIEDYNAAFKTARTSQIDTATVKDENDTIISMSFLDRPEFTKIQAARDAKKVLSYETKELMDDARRIAVRDKVSLEEQCKEIMLPYFNNEVRHFFGHEYGEVDICPEVVNVCAKRTDQLATREKGIDGASHAVKGCIMHTLTKAKDALEDRRATQPPYQGILALKKSMIPVESFDREQKDWSFAMTELVQDNENRKELNHHQRQNTDITTLNVMMGRNSISSSILPCVNNSYTTYFIGNNNNNIIINNFVNNKECHKKLREYKDAVDKILLEEDFETRKAMKAELDKSGIIPEIRKRKRDARDSPPIQKRLKTAQEAIKLEQEKDVDIRPIIIMTSERVVKKNPHGTKECAFCEKVKPLKSFYNASRSTAHIRNVCHTCISIKRKADRATQGNKGSLSQEM